MNLIQIQDQIKGLPTQAIMAYANGMNPEVPPYLALAELSRRKQMEQSMQGQQAQAAGPQSTVAQGLQQSMMPPPMEQGVAAIPAASDMYSSRGFAKGGIVAFAGGGLPDDIPGYDGPVPERNWDPDEDEKKQGLLALLANSDLLRKLGAAGADVAALPINLIRNIYSGKQSMTPYYDALRDKEEAPAGATPGVARQPQNLGAPSPWAGRTAQPATPQAKTVPASAPRRAAASGIAALTPKGPVEAEDPLETAATKALQDFFNFKPDMPESPEARRARDPRLNTPVGEEAMKRYAAMDEEQKRIAADRPLQDLIAMGRAFATAPGGRQAGVAFANMAGEYDTRTKANQKEDRDYALKMNELKLAVESARRAEARGDFDAVTKWEEKIAEIKAKLAEDKGRVGANVYATKEGAKTRLQVAADARADRAQRAGADSAARADSKDNALRTAALQRAQTIVEQEMKNLVTPAPWLNKMAPEERVQQVAAAYYRAMKKMDGAGGDDTMPAPKVATDVFNPATGKIEPKR
jgi:hypothetical protein